LFTVEPGLPQRWTCCRRGADEDKLARCKAITVKVASLRKRFNSPGGAPSLFLNREQMEDGGVAGLGGQFLERKINIAREWWILV
jgi:hypothetical protein